MRVGTLGILAFWLVVMAVLYFAMQYTLEPKGATVTAEGAVVIPRHHDGHFRVAGSVNGVPVMFLVDTGASLVGVTDTLARQAGLPGGDPITFQPATRLRDAARTRLRNWEISDAQLGKTGLVLTAPADAVVIEKPVVQGARFEPAETILRLADLSTVWVIAKGPAAQAFIRAKGLRLIYPDGTVHDLARMVLQRRIKDALTGRAR